MGYRVVTVNPLKPFALLSFGLANVASLDDARQQIETRGRAAATMEIEANEDYQALDAKIKEMSAVLVNIMLFPRKSDAHAHEIEKIEKEIRGFEGAREEIACLIREKHNKVAKGEISRLELRWSTIEPALKLHLARQVRRMTHFKESCRLVGCNNPRRLRRGRGVAGNTKGRRPGVRPLFCGAHVGLRKCLAKDALDQLHASSANRVELF